MLTFLAHPVQMIQPFLFMRLGQEVVLEHRLEITEVLQGEEGDDVDRKPVRENSYKIPLFNKI